MNTLLADTAAVIEDASRERQAPFQWYDDPIAPDALTDPQGYLPLLSAVACQVCEHVGIPAPLLMMHADADASFDWRLESFRVDPKYGVAAFLLTLRTIVIDLEPDLSIHRHALDDYTATYPASNVAPHGQEIE